jgi:hypothetical protein
VGRHNFVPPSSEQTEYTSVSSLLSSAVPTDPEATQPRVVFIAEHSEPELIGVEDWARPHVKRDVRRQLRRRKRRAWLGRRFSWFRPAGSVLRRADRFDLCLLGIIIAQPALSDPTHFMTWAVTGIMLVLWIATLVRQ